MTMLKNKENWDFKSTHYFGVTNLALRYVYNHVKRLGLRRCVELEKISYDRHKYTMEMMESLDGPRAEITNRDHGCLVQVISASRGSV